MNEYVKDEDVILAVTFRKVNNDLHDPTNVFFKVKDPSNNVETFQYGIDLEVVRDSLGKYHMVQDADESGIWTYKGYATGDGKSADEEQFRVLPTAFP